MCRPFGYCVLKFLYDYLNYLFSYANYFYIMFFQFLDESTYFYIVKRLNGFIKARSLLLSIDFILLNLYEIFLKFYNIGKNNFIFIINESLSEINKSDQTFDMFSNFSNYANNYFTEILFNGS